MYSPGHVQADEGEEEVNNEHLKRYISTRRLLDPVFTLPLPTYFRNQVNDGHRDRMYFTIDDFKY